VGAQALAGSCNSRARHRCGNPAGLCGKGGQTALSHMEMPRNYFRDLSGSSQRQGLLSRKSAVQNPHPSTNVDAQNTGPICVVGVIFLTAFLSASACAFFSSIRTHLAIRRALSPRRVGPPPVRLSNDRTNPTVRAQASPPRRENRPEREALFN
jgi:hypothetical protein